MNNKRYFRFKPVPTAAISFGLLLVFLFAVSAAYAVDVPAWVRDAAQQSAAPGAPPNGEANAVILYDEQETNVKDNGEIETMHRRAFLILRPGGKSAGILNVPFDPQMKIVSIRGWCLPKAGKEYEVKDKDAMEVNFDEEFYSDVRNVVAYEYRQKSRPFILQDEWSFQSELPMRRSIFTVNLPPGWKFKSYWMHYPEQSPKVETASEMQWEVDNIPAMKEEPGMPAWGAVAGRMGVTYVPPAGSAALGPSDWPEIGKWFEGLATSSVQATPEIQQRVKEVTSGATTWMDKAQALANYVQSHIRYVAIEIGVGGYQPHTAGDVFKHQYGDCKDKATLLRVMLHEAGIESNLALAQVYRGIVNPDFASAITFNHVILAIHVPDDAPTQSLFALVNDSKLGKLLFFDPTSSYTPFGYLPTYMQDNYVLLASAQGGELVHLPLQAPSTNCIFRTAKLQLDSDGSLHGVVDEQLIGSDASSERERLLSAPGVDRTKVIEAFLATFLGGFHLTEASTSKLDTVGTTLKVHYEFTAEHYAKPAGDLLILRPRVLGEKVSSFPEAGARKFPIEFDEASLQTDDFEITLPPGFSVDDSPSPVKADAGFASYSSEVQVTPGMLHYKRTYQVNQITIPADQIAALRKFNRQVAGDENASVVLKKSQ
jgi:transglutaminase-like putative cysteine protease